MSPYEQKKEAPDARYQFLLFAADPYETIAFKIPNLPIDRAEGQFYTNWSQEHKLLTLRLQFQKPTEK